MSVTVRRDLMNEGLSDRKLLEVKSCHCLSISLLRSTLETQTTATSSNGHPPGLQVSLFLQARQRRAMKPFKRGCRLCGWSFQVLRAFGVPPSTRTHDPVT